MSDKISLYDIVYFLTEEIDTLAWGFGGGARVKECRKDDGRIYYKFRLEPGNRERQDHWILNMSDLYDEDGDEIDAYQDWQESWATPLEEETERLLEERFPLLKNCGPGFYETPKGKYVYNQWQVDVDEKGYVHFTFHSTIVENLGKHDGDWRSSITLPTLRLYKTGETHSNGQDVYRKVGDVPKSGQYLTGTYYVGDKDEMYICGSGYVDKYGAWDGEPLYDLHDYTIVAMEKK
tara:strand:- start:548 stop:1252 length:705 start_codon:yes stop_codon:yes gene_type:complete